MKELKLSKTPFVIIALFIIAEIVGILIAALVFHVDFSSGSDGFIFLIFVIIITTITAICGVLGYFRQKKDVAALNAYRNELGDDALFFEGMFVVEGQRKEDAKKTAKSVLLSLPLAAVTGIGIYKTHYHNPSRIFIVSKNKVYSIERQTMHCTYFDGTGVYNAAVTEPKYDRVILTLNNGAISCIFYTKKSEMTNNELGQRLENIFAVDVTAQTTDIYI